MNRLLSGKETLRAMNAVHLMTGTVSYPDQDTHILALMNTQLSNGPLGTNTDQKGGNRPLEYRGGDLPHSPKMKTCRAER